MRARQDVRGSLLPYSRPSVSVQQILVDAHSGRLFGRFGTFFVDAVGIAALLLATSGVWMMWRTSKARRKQANRMAGAKPAAAKPAAPVAAKPVTAPVAVAKPAASGSASVQIGAYTSTDIANAEYAKVASSYGLFVGGASKRIEKVTTPNGTFYRTAFTGLSADKAKSFCSALKASGHDCIVK